MTKTRPPLRDSYEALLGRAQAAWRAGDVEKAIALYRRLVDRLGRLSERVLERRPDLGDMHRRARLEMTNLLRLEGRYAEAIEVVAVLLETHPDEAEIWRTELAVLRVAKGEVDAGLAELQSLAEQDSDNPWKWMTLGSEARIEGRFVESQAAFDRARDVCNGEDPPALVEIYRQRFYLFRDMGQLDQAVAEWEKAVGQDAEVAKSVRIVYSALTDAGRYSEAQRYINRDENGLQAGFQRGLIASLTGDSAEATAHWRQAAKLDPSEFEYGHEDWVESVLRLGDPLPALEWLQVNLSRYGTPRLLVLSGIGWAMNDDVDLASVLLRQATNLLRRSRPPRQKLDSSDWRLLDSLVADDETKARLKPYFAVVDTIWDAPASSPRTGEGQSLILHP